ncbi:MAG: PIG-L family deacetylase [Nocardioides sp.]
MPEASRKTLVVFHAHPDDEALMTAGTMAWAADQGHRVVLVVATDGELGATRALLTSPPELGQVRRQEAAESARSRLR